MTYLHVGSRVPVLNKCWKAGTGVLIAKRSQRKSIFPKEQSDQDICRVFRGDRKAKKGVEFGTNNVLCCKNAR